MEHSRASAGRRSHTPCPDTGGTAGSRRSEPPCRQGSSGHSGRRTMGVRPGPQHSLTAAPGHGTLQDEGQQSPQNPSTGPGSQLLLPARLTTAPRAKVSQRLRLYHQTGVTQRAARHGGVRGALRGHAATKRQKRMLSGHFSPGTPLNQVPYKFYL